MFDAFLGWLITILLSYGGTVQETPEYDELFAPIENFQFDPELTKAFLKVDVLPNYEPDDTRLTKCDEWISGDLERLYFETPEWEKNGEYFQSEEPLKACQQAQTEFPESQRISFKLELAKEAISIAEIGWPNMFALAQQGYAPAFAALVEYHFFEEMDLSEEQLLKFNLLHYGAQLGDGHAMMSIGINYIVREQYDEALKWLHKGVEAGNPTAMMALGEYYADDAPYAESNKDQTLYWMRRAAIAGDIRAMFELSKIYLEGRSTEADLDRGARWALVGHALQLGLVNWLGWDDDPIRQTMRKPVKRYLASEGRYKGPLTSEADQAFWDALSKWISEKAHVPLLKDLVKEEEARL